jgi:hypothetical protein
MKSLCYIFTLVVGGLFLYAVIVALWMIIQIVAIAFVVVAIIWLIRKVFTLLNKKPP